MKSLSRFISLCAAVLCALGLFAACNNDRQPEPVHYTVTVVCEDELILSGLEVELYTEDGSLAARSPIADGKAQFSLPAAIYTVRVAPMSGFETILDGYTVSSAVVTATTSAATVTISYSEGGDDETVLYKVTVTLPDGSPVADIQIQLCGGPSNACYPSLVPTDENGTVTLSLPAGIYEVHIEQPFWPENYTFDNDQYTMSESGGELTVSFTPAP